MRKLALLLVLLALNDVLLVAFTKHGQIRYDLVANATRQNTPYRVNVHSDVPACFVTDGSCGNSLLAVCMDPGAMTTNRTGDPKYSAYFGWTTKDTGSLYFDQPVFSRLFYWHNNANICIHIGGQGSGQPNHVMIGDFYVMPYGLGKPGQVIAVPETGNQLVWR